MTDHYLLGIDYGTESCRVGIFTADGRPVTFAATPYPTHRPKPGWAEQSPTDWWDALVASTHQAMAQSGLRPEQIAGIGYDATSYSLVPTDADGNALRDAIMWMDVRATRQAARADSLEGQVRRYNAGGTQPNSAEWAPFKLAWLKENEPETYDRARWLLDAPDWVGAQLTGEFSNNTCSASIRMYHDRTQGGFLHQVYDVAGCGDVFAKLPEAVNPLGTQLGVLTQRAAHALGLRPGTPVAQGGIDAEHGMVGLNVLTPGRMSLTTGSSHVMLGQAQRPISGTGFWGAFTDAVVPGLFLVETSGVSTGSALNWFKDHFAHDVLIEAEQQGVSAYDLLNERSKDLPPGSDGLIINEYFQGNRTPYSDSKARGVMLGLTLSHRPHHIYRALQEAVCYGVALNLKSLAASGFVPTEMVMCGGATRSRDWVQMHADVTGVPIVLTEVGDAVALGSCVLAAAAAGVYPSVSDAAQAMVHEKETVQPRADIHEQYVPLVRLYGKLYPAVHELQHELTDLTEARA